MFFSAVFAKGDNFCVFLFASLNNIPPQKLGLKFDPERANSFLYELMRKSVNDTVASPESVPIHLKFDVCPTENMRCTTKHRKTKERSDT